MSDLDDRVFNFVLEEMNNCENAVDVHNFIVNLTYHLGLCVYISSDDDQKLICEMQEKVIADLQETISGLYCDGLVLREDKDV